MKLRQFAVLVFGLFLSREACAEFFHPSELSCHEGIYGLRRVELKANGEPLKDARFGFDSIEDCRKNLLQAIEKKYILQQYFVDYPGEVSTFSDPNMLSFARDYGIRWITLDLAIDLGYIPPANAAHKLLQQINDLEKKLQAIEKELAGY